LLCNLTCRRSDLCDGCAANDASAGHSQHYLMNNISSRRTGAPIWWPCIKADRACSRVNPGMHYHHQHCSIYLFILFILFIYLFICVFNPPWLLGAVAGIGLDGIDGCIESHQLGEEHVGVIATANASRARLKKLMRRRSLSPLALIGRRFFCSLLLQYDCVISLLYLQ
jgi:hypothetical protein